MYARSYREKQRQTPAHVYTPPQGEQLLIPKEYHGEMLRGVKDAPQMPRSGQEREDPMRRMPEPIPQEQNIRYEEDWQETNIPAAAMAEAETPLPASGTHGGLLSGLFDLLLGKNSSEEETILLLGIAVILLSGHLDRSGGFSAQDWDGDDLALLLIGYLLLT